MTKKEFPAENPPELKGFMSFDEMLKRKKERESKKEDSKDKEKEDKEE